MTRGRVFAREGIALLLFLFVAITLILTAPQVFGQSGIGRAVGQIVLLLLPVLVLSRSFFAIRNVLRTAGSNNSASDSPARTPHPPSGITRFEALERQHWRDAIEVAQHEEQRARLISQWHDELLVSLLRSMTDRETSDLQELRRRIARRQEEETTQIGKLFARQLGARPYANELLSAVAELFALHSRVDEPETLFLRKIAKSLEPGWLLEPALVSDLLPALSGRADAVVRSMEESFYLTTIRSGRRSIVGVTKLWAAIATVSDLGRHVYLLVLSSAPSEDELHSADEEAREADIGLVILDESRQRVRTIGKRAPFLADVKS